LSLLNCSSLVPTNTISNIITLYMILNGMSSPKKPINNV